MSALSQSFTITIILMMIILLLIIILIITVLKPRVVGPDDGFPAKHRPVNQTEWDLRGEGGIKSLFMLVLILVLTLMSILLLMLMLVYVDVGVDRPADQAGFCLTFLSMIILFSSTLPALYSSLRGLVATQWLQKKGVRKFTRWLSCQREMEQQWLKCEPSAIYPSRFQIQQWIKFRNILEIKINYHTHEHRFKIRIRSRLIMT